jgi:hypothetical protein
VEIQMAEIRLGRAEVERGRLPKRCMVCGGRSSVKRKRKFSWAPPWAMLAGGLLMLLFFTKRMTMNVPLCHAHRNHWLMRSLLSGFGFVGIFLLAAVIVFAVAIKSAGNGPDDKPLMEALAFGGLLMLGWLAMTIALQLTAIRAKEITDKSMTLIGVSDSFISALKDLRDARRNPVEEVVRVVRRRVELDDEEDEDDDD